MDKHEDLLLRLNTIAQNNESLYKGLEDVSVRFNRMAAAAEQADTVIDDIQEQFLSATKLKTIDVGFFIHGGCSAGCAAVFVYSDVGTLGRPRKRKICKNQSLYKSWEWEMSTQIETTNIITRALRKLRQIQSRLMRTEARTAHWRVAASWDTVL